MKKLSREFYQQPTPNVAKLLLGKYLVRRTKNGILTGKITETEAYAGFSDKASHASRGKTTRNEPMFYKGGFVYIYLIYGIYHCLNVVTERENYPAAVLIRAIEIDRGDLSALRGAPTKLGGGGCLRDNKSSIKTDGPGKLCNYFQIDRSLNKVDLCKNKEIWIAENIKEKEASPKDIISSGRVGVDYAGKYWAKRKWRFILK